MATPIAIPVTAATAIATVTALTKSVDTLNKSIGALAVSMGKHTAAVKASTHAMTGLTDALHKTTAAAASVLGHFGKLGAVAEEILRKFEGVASTFGKVGSAGALLGPIIAGLVVTLAAMAAAVLVAEKAWEFFTESLAAAARVQQLETRLKGVTGSAKEAAEVLEKIDKVVADAGGQFGITQAALGDFTVRMRLLGKTSAEVEGMIAGISELAAQTGGNFGDLGSVILRVTTILKRNADAGGASIQVARVFNMLAFQGVDVYKRLAAAYGVSTRAAIQMAQAGMVSEQAMTAIIIRAGQDQKNLREQSETMLGVFGTIRVKWEQIKEAFGRPIDIALTKLFKGIIPLQDQMIAKAKELGESFADMVDHIMAAWRQGKVMDVIKGQFKIMFLEVVQFFVQILGKEVNTMLANFQARMEAIPGTPFQSAHQGFDKPPMLWWEISGQSDKLDAWIQARSAQIQGQQQGAPGADIRLGKEIDSEKKTQEALYKEIDAVDKLTAVLEKFTAATGITPSKFLTGRAPAGPKPYSDQWMKDVADIERQRKAAAADMPQEDLPKPDIPDLPEDYVEDTEKAAENLRKANEEAEKTKQEIAAAAEILPEWWQGFIKAADGLADMNVLINDVGGKAQEIMKGLGSDADKAQDKFDLVVDAAEKLKHPLEDERALLLLLDNDLDRYVAHWVLAYKQRQLQEKRWETNAKANALTVGQTALLGIQKLNDAWGSWQTQGQQAIQDIGNALVTSIAGPMQQILDGTVSLKDGFRAMALGIVQSIEQIILKMLIQLAIQRLLGMIPGAQAAMAGPPTPVYVVPAPGSQHGGPITGVGTKDTVPAMLSPGEFVINRISARRIGLKNLHKLNKMEMGGLVSSRRHHYQDAVHEHPDWWGDFPAGGGNFPRGSNAFREARFNFMESSGLGPREANYFFMSPGYFGPAGSNWFNQGPTMIPTTMGSSGYPMAVPVNTSDVISYRSMHTPPIKNKQFGGEIVRQYHTGGIVDTWGEFASGGVVKGGEGVFTRDQMKHLAPAHGNTQQNNIKIDIVNNNGQVRSNVQTSAKGTVGGLNEQDAREIARMTVTICEKTIAKERRAGGSLYSPRAG